MHSDESNHYYNFCLVNNDLSNLIGSFTVLYFTENTQWKFCM